MAKKLYEITLNSDDHKTKKILLVSEKEGNSYQVNKSLINDMLKRFPYSKSRAVWNKALCSVTDLGPVTKNAVNVDLTDFAGPCDLILR